MKLLILLITPFLLNAQTIKANLVKVHDGDTIRVNLTCNINILCKNIPVRIAHIDTPELHGKCAIERAKAVEAKDKLRIMLQNANDIEIRDIKRDKYFRILGNVYANNVNVADMLISEKLAVKYEGKTKKGWCEG